MLCDNDLLGRNRERGKGGRIKGGRRERGGMQIEGERGKGREESVFLAPPLCQVGGV